MEQVCLIVGVVCSVIGVVLAFLHDWKVDIVRRDKHESSDKRQ